MQRAARPPPLLILVPGANEGEDTPVLNGHPFIKLKEKNGKVYYKCCHIEKECRAGIVLVENHLVSSVPKHNHGVPWAVKANQTLQKKAKESCIPIGVIVNEAMEAYNDAVMNGFCHVPLAGQYEFTRQRLQRDAIQTRRDAMAAILVIPSPPPSPSPADLQDFPE